MLKEGVSGKRWRPEVRLSPDIYLSLLTLLCSMLKVNCGTKVQTDQESYILLIVGQCHLPYYYPRRKDFSKVSNDETLDIGLVSKYPKCE